MKIRRTNDGKLLFYCKGCERYHGVNYTWYFNDNFEKPTFSPSVLVKGVQDITEEEHDLIMSGVHVEPRQLVCHSFVVDGKIQYLNDCTHEYAGQTIELEDIKGEAYE